MWLDEITNWLNQYPYFKFIGILLLASILYLITKYILLNGIKKLISKTPTNIDDLLLNDKILSRLAFIPPFLLIHEFTYLLPAIHELLNRISEAIIALIVLLLIGTIITAFNDIYENFKRADKGSIKGYLQVLKIVVYVMGGIIIAGLLTGQEPWTLFTGIGALTAVLLLVFKDTILSFVASIQISSYDLVKVGDWIEVPKYGADGDVIDMALHTIKVQNWDKTITVIPTHKLIEESFKNWRGMTMTGGRRIKRAIYIDLASVKFCDEQMLQRFEKFQLLSDYIRNKKEEIQKFNKELNVDESSLINGRRLTNIGTFREYLKAYLRKREDVDKGLTFLIRQLSPGPEGIPIEIYVFANTTEWVPYEEIQSDIFDHLFAVIPEFELNIFQHPSGSDFQKISTK